MFGIPNCWILRAIIFLATSYMCICIYIYIRAEYEEVIELYIYICIYTQTLYMEGGSGGGQDCSPGIEVHGNHSKLR